MSEYDEFEPTEKEIKAYVNSRIHKYELEGKEVTPSLRCVIENSARKNLRIQKQYGNVVPAPVEFVKEVNWDYAMDLVVEGNARLEDHWFGYTDLYGENRDPKVKDFIKWICFKPEAYKAYENSPYVVFIVKHNDQPRCFIFRNTKYMFVPVCEGGYTCKVIKEVGEIIKNML